MRNRPAVERDIGLIWPKLAERMTNEYELAGLTSQKVRIFFKDWIKSGTADTLLEGNNRLAIIAWQMNEGSMITSFAGTDAFFEPRFVRASARYIEGLQKSHRNCQLESHSYSEHPEVIRWFKILGFALDSSSDGIHKVFVRPPK